MEQASEFSIDKVTAQMRKGVLELPILLIIAQKEVYASEILSRLKNSNLLVVEGTLYPLLSRLRKAGLVDYSWKESDSGPPRKYYQITEKGKTSLQGLESAWTTLTQSINQLIKEYEESR